VLLYALLLSHAVSVRKISKGLPGPDEPERYFFLAVDIFCQDKQRAPCCKGVCREAQIQQA
jgi:hypothetical protein